MQYFVFSISITLISWFVGMFFTAVLKNKSYYVNLSNLNFIKSRNINKKIGLGSFKWIVRNTFLKYLNHKLRLKKKVEMTELNELREEMTFSEISHLIGFGFVTIFAIVKFINVNFLFGLIIMIVNILLNLYPSLLQQENKRRIDRLIKMYS